MAKNMMKKPSQWMWDHELLPERVIRMKSTGYPKTEGQTEYRDSVATNKRYTEANVRELNKTRSTY